MGPTYGSAIRASGQLINKGRRLTFSKTLKPANWPLDGCEERVTVSAAERVDATHAKLTLAGKSGSVYTSRHVTVTCTGEEYTDSREYDEGRGIYRKSGN